MGADRNDPVLQRYLQASAAALKAGDMARAFAIGADAVAQGIDHPNLLSLAAQQRLRGNDVDGAHELLLRARALAPHDPVILNELGFCLVCLGRAKESLSLFEAALRQAPDSAPVHFNRALALEQLNEVAQMRRALERAVAIDPNHVGALGLLAQLAADRNDGKAARDYAARALALSPGEPVARIALAAVEIAASGFGAARDHIDRVLREPGLNADVRANAQTLLGDLLDAEGKFAQAFAAYSAAADTLKAHYRSARNQNPAWSQRALVRRLTDYFTAAGSGWRAQKSGPEKPCDHVFLVGFLRSGTTLLGQIFAGHPGMDVMQERPCLQDAIDDFITPPDGLERLLSLSESGLEHYRQSYWRRAAEYGHTRSRAITVDKSPLASVHLPLVAKLFPDAKIIFALRDPRDVVFSCFRRRFAMTAEKYEMLSLADIAAYYAGVMNLAGIYRQRLGLDVLDARHEALLGNFEAETRRITAFLGLEWNSAMADFSGRLDRAGINTPASARLGQALSPSSRWRHYREFLAPILPALQPWCARFGYPPD